MITLNQFGRIIAIKQEDQTWKRYRIANLSQQQCKLSDQTIGAMVSCINVTDLTDEVMIHPEHLARLFSETAEGIHIVDSAVIDNQVSRPVDPNPVIGRTKKARAAEIYADLKREDASRENIITAFMEILDMSKAGATTYYRNLTRFPNRKK